MWCHCRGQRCRLCQLVSELLCPPCQSWEIKPPHLFHLGNTEHILIGSFLPKPFWTVFIRCIPFHTLSIPFRSPGRCRQTLTPNMACGQVNKKSWQKSTYRAVVLAFRSLACIVEANLLTCPPVVFLVNFNWV